MARGVKRPAFEISEPLAVRLPLPVRWNGGLMEIESLGFDGRIVRAIYRKHEGQAAGWWYGQAIHEIEYLPRVKTIEAAIEHVSMRRPRREYQKGRLVKTGAGWSIRLSPVGVAGGTNWIYVVTPRGSLCIPDSKYQSYRVGSIRVLNE